jgi:hypothetical protein
MHDMNDPFHNLKLEPGDSIGGDMVLALPPPRKPYNPPVLRSLGTCQTIGLASHPTTPRPPRR